MSKAQPDHALPWSDPTVPHPDADEFVHEMNIVLQHLGDWTFEALAARLAEIEANFTARLSEQPQNLLFMRRGILDHLLMASHETARPVDQYERTFIDRLALGWDDLYQQAISTEAFIRYCLDHGHPELARRYLAPLRLLIQAEQERTNADWCAPFLASLP